MAKGLLLLIGLGLMASCSTAPPLPELPESHPASALAAEAAPPDRAYLLPTGSEARPIRNGSAVVPEAAPQGGSDPMKMPMSMPRPESKPGAGK